MCMSFVNLNNLLSFSLVAKISGLLLFTVVCGIEITSIKYQLRLFKLIGFLFISKQRLALSSIMHKKGSRNQFSVKMSNISVTESCLTHQRFLQNLLKIRQLVIKYAYKMLAHEYAVCGYVYTVSCEKHGTNARKCAMAWV